MDLNELLKTLNEDLALNKHLLKQISDAIVEQQVSNYPVFVAFRYELAYKRFSFGRICECEYCQRSDGRSF